VIILPASCIEGFGEDVFKEWMGQAKDYEAISSRLKDNFVLGGHKAVAVARVISSKKVFLYSEFDRADTYRMVFEKLDDIQSYIEAEIDRNEDIEITIIPASTSATS